MGRPTKCTPELIKRICKFVAEPQPIVIACQACGITETSYYEWLNRAKDEPESIYSEFSKAVEKARAEGFQNLCRIIIREAPKDWKAAARLLEGMYQDYFALRVKYEGKVEHEHKHTHQVEYTRLQELPEQRKQAIVEEMMGRIEEYKAKQLPLEAEVVNATDKEENGIAADPQGPTTKKNTPGWHPRQRST